MTTILKLEQGLDPHPLRARLQALGLYTELLRGGEHDVLIRIKPGSLPMSIEEFEALDGVEQVFATGSPHPLVDARRGKPVMVDELPIGPGAPPVMMAGPCSVESEEQVMTAAAYVARQGVRILRGGCFKPRTSPHTFQGMGRAGLVLLRRAADAHGLKVVTEAMAPAQVEFVGDYADIFQIGARNMQNFELLKAVGQAGRPVLLKRGISSTIQEWLLAGEYLYQYGASGVIFCERGVRGGIPHGETRFVLDLSAVALMRQVHDLAVIADPSHAAGRKDLLAPLARASLTCGADGLMIETHPEPAQACSDGPQQLDPQEFVDFCEAIDWPRVVADPERHLRPVGS